MQKSFGGVSLRTNPRTYAQDLAGALLPGETIEWLEQVIYPAVLSFQKAVASGGGEAALVLLCAFWSLRVWWGRRDAHACVSPAA